MKQRVEFYLYFNIWLGVTSAVLQRVALYTPVSCSGPTKGIFYSWIHFVCGTLKDAAVTIPFAMWVCSHLWELRLKVGLFCQCVIDGLKVTLLHYIKSLEDTDTEKWKDQKKRKRHSLHIHLHRITISHVWFNNISFEHDRRKQSFLKLPKRVLFRT